jgi:serine/threonine protein kinase
MLIGSPPFYHENHRVLYENIVHKKAYFPSGFDWIAQDLIERLIEKDPHKRLGALANGAADVKAHPWFRDVNWKQLEACELRPPFKPKIAGEGDTSNFDQYPDEIAESPSVDPSQFTGLFLEF